MSNNKTPITIWFSCKIEQTNANVLCTTKRPSHVKETIIEHRQDILNDMSS
jgi:hypothetical protein